MTLSILGLALALGLSLNIGANNAGVHMAPAFGAGARGKWASLVLFAAFALLGAILLGGRVVKTIGADLFEAGSLVSHPWFFLVLAPLVTVLLLALANFLRIPVPTTPVAICSLVGVGFALEATRTSRVGEILLWWVLSPLPVLALTWLTGKLLVARFPGLLHPERLSPRARRAIAWFLTFEGCYSAFAIGSNNVANAMAPVVGAGTLGGIAATVVGGLAMGAGALLWGGRVLETVGKGITELCAIRALFVGVFASTALLVSSWFGVPVSGAFIVTLGVIGFSLAVEGTRSTAENRSVRRILAFWSLGPALAALVTYAAVAAAPRISENALLASAIGAALALLLGGAVVRYRRSRAAAPKPPETPQAALNRVTGGC
jgi:phosphate/sulfate permease